MVENAIDAKNEWITACIEDGISIPAPSKQPVPWY